MAILSSCADLAPTAARGIPRVGVLSLQSAASAGVTVIPPTGSVAYGEALLAGLRELGYEDGKNIAVEFRVAPEEERAGRTTEEHWGDTARELVASRVDVIVAYGTLSQLAAKAATSTVPIVMFGGSDPVEAGLVTDLARPGGNITGVTSVVTDFDAKRLELLREAFPSIKRVAICGDTTVVGNMSRRSAQAAARTLGLDFVNVAVTALPEVRPALEAAAKLGIDSIIVLGSTTLFRTEFRAFVAEYRLPVIYESVASVDNGGLMAYNVKPHSISRRVAKYVVRILQGERPADMPIENPTEFEIVINLKTAREQGLTISPTVMNRATRVVQ